MRAPKCTAVRPVAGVTTAHQGAPGVQVPPAGDFRRPLVRLSHRDPPRQSEGRPKNRHRSLFC